MRGVLLLALLRTSGAAPAAAPVPAGRATRSVRTADPSRASAATPTPAATASASTGATASAMVSASATASATPRAAPAPQAPPAPRVVRSPFIFKDREGWVLGYQDGNIVLRPERGGALRLPVPIYGSVSDITFADILHGWALGRIVRGPQTNCQHAARYPPCRDVILGTTDGGRSWSLLLAYETTGITGETFRALQFTDARHGWAIQFRDSCSLSGRAHRHRRRRRDVERPLAFAGRRRPGPCPLRGRAARLGDPDLVVDRGRVGLPGIAHRHDE